MKRHAETLWACDFMGKRVLTIRGWREAFFIVFINIATRRVWASPCSFKPKRRWTAQQAVAFIEAHRDDSNAPQTVLHDCDSKFQGAFKRALRKREVTPLMTRPRAPNMNAYAERIVQTIQQECLDHFAVLGRPYIDYLTKEFLEHYHFERSHQSLGNEPPVRAGPRRPAQAPVGGQVECDERLGGLLKSYRRAA